VLQEPAVGGKISVREEQKLREIAEPEVSVGLPVEASPAGKRRKNQASDVRGLLEKNLEDAQGDVGPVEWACACEAVSVLLGAEVSQLAGSWGGFGGALLARRSGRDLYHDELQTDAVDELLATADQIIAAALGRECPGVEFGVVSLRRAVQAACKKTAEEMMLV
jgi:hypothetical protein